MFLPKNHVRPYNLLRPFSAKSFSERPFSEKSLYPQIIGRVPMHANGNIMIMGKGYTEDLEQELSTQGRLVLEYHVVCLP